MRGGSFQRRVMARPFTVEELEPLPPLHDARMEDETSAWIVEALRGDE
jgi:hypothetical protein